VNLLNNEGHKRRTTFSQHHSSIFTTLTLPQPPPPQAIYKSFYKAFCSAKCLWERIGRAREAMAAVT
jgi:hypothetical protein